MYIGMVQRVLIAEELIVRVVSNGVLNLRVGRKYGEER